MSIIRKFCSRCGKEITIEKETYYLQIFQREDRGRRDTGFLCNRCCDDFIKFMGVEE